MDTVETQNADANAGSATEQISEAMRNQVYQSGTTEESEFTAVETSKSTERGEVEPHNLSLPQQEHGRSSTHVRGVVEREFVEGVCRYSYISPKYMYRSEIHPTQLNGLCAANLCVPIGVKYSITIHIGVDKLECTC